METGGLELTVVVDGAPAPEYAARGRVYVEALRGREFALRIRNPYDERIAVAVSVDGRNVVDAKRSAAGRATKWLLEPRQTLEIPGWQVSGETARRFFFTETSRSYASWLGDTRNVGLIEAVFYRERRPRIALVDPERRLEGRRSGKDREEQSGSRQPPGGRSGEAGDEVQGGVPENAPATRAPAPDADASKRRGDARERGAVIPRDDDEFAATGIGERTRFPVRWTSFAEDPTPFGRIAIRYEFRRELVRLGVLPREDDLWARERARGFDPDYAPDPYRHR